MALVLGLAGSASADYISAQWVGPSSVPDMSYMYVWTTASGAPAGAIITSVRYRIRVDDRGDPDDFWCSDYEIHLSNTTHGAGAKYMTCWNNLGDRTDDGDDDDFGDDTDIYLEWRTTHMFDGENPNQTWYCRVEDNQTNHYVPPFWVYDGLGQLEYAQLEIHYEVPPANPPVASDLAITPMAPTTVDNLVGSYTYFDADGDPESGTEIRWYKNGALQTAYNDQLTIPSAATSLGQNWYFTVKPKDGLEFGELKTSPTVTIHETPPIMVVVPDVVGMAQSDAESAITGDDLVVVISYRTSDTVPEGHVITQEPSGGTSVPEGSEVNLTISAGWFPLGWLLLLAPNGGEVLPAGSTYPIRWETGGTVGNVLIQYSTDNGGTWAPVEPPNIGNSGSYNWLVPQVTSDRCRVLISDASSPDVISYSDAAFTISGGAPGPVDVRLVAHWKFDETAGNIAHDNSGDNDGILFGNPIWQPTAGMVGGALDFDGTGDYVQIPKIGESVEFTYAMWVAQNQIGSSLRTLIGHKDWIYGSVQLELRDGHPKVGINEAITPAGDLDAWAHTLAAGEWHHVALAKSATLLVIYVDGQEAARRELITSDTVILGDGFIGAWVNPAWGQTRYFNGLLDDVRIYSCALDENEIKALSMTSAPPVAHWELDETSGVMASDSSGNDNHGTVYGNPIWLPAGGIVGGALMLDGANDYISTPFVLNPADGALSAVAWIKAGYPGQVIISQTGGMGLGRSWLCTDSLDGKLMTDLRAPGRSGYPLISQTVITDGNWHRIAFVWDGSYRHLYVDGAEVIKDSRILYALESADGGLHFGAGNALDAGSFWFGLIDDVRIYDYALSAEEIDELAP